MKASLIACLLLYQAVAACAQPKTAWSVDTPKGKFECVEQSTNSANLKMRLGNAIVYDGRFQGLSSYDGELKNGMPSSDVGCPTLVSASGTYLIVARNLLPPSFGVTSYAIIDLTGDVPEWEELVSGQRPSDEKVSSATRAKWDKAGLSFFYFGYPAGDPGGDVKSAKPHQHLVRYDFDSGKIRQVN